MSDYGLVGETVIECPDCGEKVYKHIIKEGARYHVLHWDGEGAHCSHSRCEENHKCKKGKYER